MTQPDRADLVDRLAHTSGVEIFLARRLAPAQTLDPALWASLLDDLDAEDFAIRQKAEERIKALGQTGENAARATLKTEKRLEVRRRLSRLAIRSLLNPESLRQLRAIFILEQQKARGLLYRLAEGDPEADPTREARSAMGRLRVAEGESVGSTRPPGPASAR